MNNLRALYHMARSDFLERVRRYSFLVMLGMIVWLGYASTTGILVLSIEPNYVGEINSAWVGALMTVTVTFFLGWFGFYLVKGSVSRDYETGVGQILATTPLSRPLYALGKWLSNFAVLGIMIFILLLAGILMNLLAGEAPLDLWALVSPLFYIALPCLALIAALAVLFETVGWLRGGFGNIVYFFMFVIMLAPNIESETYQPLFDFTGFRMIGDSISHAAQLAYADSEAGLSFQVLNTITNPQRFHYSGIDWTAEIILQRFFFILVAFVLALLASAFFDRFDFSKGQHVRKKRGKGKVPQAADPEAAYPVPAYPTLSKGVSRRFSFLSLFAAELKMLMKGHHWWWYGISAALVVAQFATPSDVTRFLLGLSWLWMILVLSGLGNREAQFNTSEIVFSAPRPLLNQLPAIWLAAVTVTAVMGSGAFLHYLLGGETEKLLAWLGGVLFIPSLALVLGVMTKSRKPFEVIYVTWMYLILNEFAPIDFVGVAPGSPWHLFTLMAMALFVLTMFARQWQLKDGSMLSKFPSTWLKSKRAHTVST